MSKGESVDKLILGGSLRGLRHANTCGDQTRFPRCAEPTAAIKHPVMKVKNAISSRLVYFIPYTPIQEKRLTLIEAANG